MTNSAAAGEGRGGEGRGGEGRGGELAKSRQKGAYQDDTREKDAMFVSCGLAVVRWGGGIDVVEWGGGLDVVREGDALHWDSFFVRVGVD